MDSKRVKKFTDLYDKLSYMYGSVDVFIDFVKCLQFQYIIRLLKIQKWNRNI